MKNYLSLVIIAFVALCIGCNEKNNKLEITLFAAAGTTLPVKELCRNYSEKTGVDIELNLASSGTLARQIASGGKANIFISANEDWMNYLKNDGILNDSTFTILARNKLVIIAPLDSDLKPFKFTRDFMITEMIENKIAIGDPSYVPVGKYSFQVFDKLNWTERLKSQTLLVKDVISVLNYVEMGECDWGIVYYSNAISSKKVKIISEIPEFLYSPVVFYISEMKNSSTNAHQFYEYLLSQEADSLFQNYGFIVN